MPAHRTWVEDEPPVDENEESLLFRRDPIARWGCYGCRFRSRWMPVHRADAQAIEHEDRHKVATPPVPQ